MVIPFRGGVILFLSQTVILIITFTMTVWRSLNPNWLIN
ncbi:hypothetical protein LINPERHAP1_LOCUS35366 [Linum perenne]